MERNQALFDAVIAQRDLAANQAAELMADKHVALARVVELEREVAALQVEVAKLKTPPQDAAEALA